MSKLRKHARRDVNRHPVLNIEDVTKRPFEPVCPDGSTVLCFGELDHHAEAAVAGMQVSGEYVSDSKHLRHVAWFKRAVPKRRRRQPRDHEEIGEPGQVGYDVLGNQIAQKIVPRHSRQVAKGQDGNRRLVTRATATIDGQSGHRSRRPGAECAYGPLESLELALPEVLDHNTQAVGELVAHCGRHDDFVRPTEIAQARRQVHAVSIDVELVGDHVGRVDAHAHPDAPVRIHRPLACNKPLLDGNRALDRADRTLEFEQHAVTGELYPAAPEPRQVLVLDIVGKCAPPTDRALFVEMNEANGFDDVDEQHRSEAALDVRLRGFFDHWARGDRFGQAASVLYNSPLRRQMASLVDRPNATVAEAACRARGQVRAGIWH